MNRGFWRGKRVFITGHTGFKGSWLSLWLQRLRARVTGYALAPPTNPNMYTVADVGSGMDSLRGDVRETGRLKAALLAAAPEIVFHLAAQPIVRRSYDDPLTTYATNVMGTANLLDAARHCDSVDAVVVITSDKVYENREWVWGYRETDLLGGHDPYSSSKACAELVVDAYRRSFYSCAKVATARAGNVIGGGDWAVDRIVPDFVRAATGNRELEVRNPGATRPFQHVLDPLYGYLMLAERLAEDGWMNAAEGWNFGPPADGVCSVGRLVEHIEARWRCDVEGKTGYAVSGDLVDHVKRHEAGQLTLDSSKARQYLGWEPRYGLFEAVAQTVDWYRAWKKGRDMKSVTLGQIERFEEVVHDAAA